MAKKSSDLAAYIKSQQKDSPVTEYKDPEYLTMPEPVQKSLGLPGFPLGHISGMYGLSDCGKTGLLLNAVAQAQKQDILPILIVTENKLDKKRIAAAGVNIDEAIIREDLKHLETIYNYMSTVIQDVLDGKLKSNVMFFWDSMAGAPSEESIEIAKDGSIKKKFTNQKNANVIGFYNPIIASRISDTRRLDCPYTVGLVFVTQAYVKPAEFPGGHPSIVPNGGEKVWYPISLAIEVKEGSRFKSVYKGKNIEYGMVSRIKVKKNHITSINCDGEVALLGTSVLENDKKVLEEFKDNNKEVWDKLLEDALQETKNGND